MLNNYLILARFGLYLSLLAYCLESLLLVSMSLAIGSETLKLGIARAVHMVDNSI